MHKMTAEKKSVLSPCPAVLTVSILHAFEA